VYLGSVVGVSELHSVSNFSVDPSAVRLEAGQSFRYLYPLPAGFVLGSNGIYIARNATLG
jgi:hypothetical protein